LKGRNGMEKSLRPDESLNYHKELQRLKRFFERDDDYGYIFATAEDERLIPQINRELVETAIENGVNLKIVFFYKQEDGLTPVIHQLQEALAETPKPDGIIIPNLDEFIRRDNKNKVIEESLRFIAELNYSREELHELRVPILFWLSKKNILLFSRIANDLLSQRRMAHTYFDAEPGFFIADENMLDRFRSEEYRSTNEFEQLYIRVNLLKKQLKDADDAKFPIRKRVNDIALPLAELYSKLDLHEDALHLIEQYQQGINPENLQQAFTIGTIKFRAKKYTDAERELLEVERKLIEKDFRDSLLSQTYSVLGDLYDELGDLSKAQNYFDRFAALNEERLNRFPQNEIIKRDLSISYNRLADTYANLGQLQQSLGLYQKALNISNELAKANPKAEQLQRDLSVSYIKLADTYANLGQLQQSLELYQKALNISNELAKANPKAEQLQRDLGVSYERLADTYAKLGQLQQSLELYQKALNIRDELAKANPKAEQLQRDLGISYEKLADTYGKLGQLQQSLDLYQKALSISQELALANPKAEQLQRDLGISYNKLADTYRKLGQLQQAFELYEKTLNIRQELVLANPKAEQLHVDLALSHYKVGLNSISNEDFTSALTHCHKAIALLKPLIKIPLITTPFNLDLYGGVCCKVIELLNYMQRNEEAEPFKVEVLEMLSRLAKTPEYHPVMFDEAENLRQQNLLPPNKD
jgi:tetratricopeptide (TPR) repeat protein